MSMKVFVISLERDTARRESVCRNLAQYGVDFELFPAVWGADVDRSLPEIYDAQSFELKNNLFSKTIIHGKLTDGELGCALSHLRLYQKIIADQLPGAIVLEDDFEANNNFTSVFGEILKVIPQAEVINGRSVARIGLRQSWFTPKHKIKAEGQEYTVYKAGIPGLDWLFNRRRRVESARCYYVSRHACERLVKLGFPVRMESDRLLGMKAYNRLNIYLVEPFLSAAGSKFDSLIGGGRGQKAV